MNAFWTVWFLALLFLAACGGGHTAPNDAAGAGDTGAAADEGAAEETDDGAVPDDDIVQPRTHFNGEQPWFGVLPTGQRKCYDEEKEIPCPKIGDPFFGQDSQFNQWKTRAFTINGDGTVYDDATHITWQSNYASGLTWSEAYSYCSSLSLAGRTWRLPTPHELKSLINYEKLTGTPPNEMPAHPATAFPGDNLNDWFWATPRPYDPLTAWIIYFYDGYMDYTSRDNRYSVRCVATS